MAAAAPTLKKVFLELGGKSAAIVLDDADLAAAVGTTAFAVCIHAGQGCALTTRLLVPRERYDEAVQVAADTMASIGAGDPTDPGTDLRPGHLGRSSATGSRATSSSPRRRAARSRPAAAVDRVTDGGFWIEPTVDRRARQHSRRRPGGDLRPGAGRHPARRRRRRRPDRQRLAVRPLRLGRLAATWSGPGRSPHRIRTGTLAVNGGVWFSADAPFGGYKQSGIGREMGVAGFEEYLETKLIAEPAESSDDERSTGQGRRRHRRGAGHRRGLRPGAGRRGRGGRRRRPQRGRPASRSPRRSRPTAARAMFVRTDVSSPESAEAMADAHRRGVRRHRPAGQQRRDLRRHAVRPADHASTGTTTGSSCR